MVITNHLRTNSLTLFLRFEAPLPGIPSHSLFLKVKNVKLLLVQDCINHTEIIYEIFFFYANHIVMKYILKMN